MGDPTAFLFGIQVGPNPVTDIVWYVGHPPTDNDQELLNLLKCINALLTGTLMPSRFAEACTVDGVSSFTDEIMAMIRADGLRFLGQIKDCGVIQEELPLVGPKTRPAPTQFEDFEGKVERLTVTQADLGCQVTFLNFRPVLTSQTIYPMVDWGTTLCWILSFYKVPDLIAMNKAMERLPAKAGQKKARNAVYNKLYIAYYKATGLAYDSGKVPKGNDLAWVKEELKKEDVKKTQIAHAVKASKGSVTP